MKLSKTLALCATGLISVAPAFAGFNQGNAVTLGGEQAFRVAAADGFSAEKRAWITQDRLDNALFLSGDKSPSAVAVDRLNGALVVTVGGRSVVTADMNSARQEGVSAQELSNRWADSIKKFLSDSARASSYIASLKRPNPLGAEVAIVERRLYAPAGTVMPVTLSTIIDAGSARVGDKIEGCLSRDVRLGNYAIPSGSIVVGELVQKGPGELGARLHTMRLASGTELPINAFVTEAYAIKTSAAHPVATLNMPANEEFGCRVPATIGVGTIHDGQTTLVLQQSTGRVIAVGYPVNVVLEQVTPVAVVTRSHAM